MIANLKERLEDAEQEAQLLRESSEKNDEQLEDLKGDLAKVIDERDRLQEEVDKLQGNAEDNEQQKELESRLHEEIDSLSSVSLSTKIYMQVLIQFASCQDKASLQREMEALRVTLAAREEENDDIDKLRREIRELEAIVREKNESLEHAASLEDEIEELRAILDEKETALNEVDARHQADLADLDDQWKSSLVQAEEKIQILEEDFAEMEARWKQATEQLTAKIMEADALNQELQQVCMQAHDWRDNLTMCSSSAAGRPACASREGQRASDRGTPIGRSRSDGGRHDSRGMYRDLANLFVN